MTEKSETRSSAETWQHKLTIEYRSIVDDHDRRTIAKFELWNGTIEEMQSIIDRANANRLPDPPQEAPDMADVLGSIKEAKDLLALAYKGGSYKSKINSALHRLTHVEKCLTQGRQK